MLAAIRVFRKLLSHDFLCKLVLSGIVLLGMMHFSEWFFTAFVEWWHRIQVLWTLL
jgi:hypothetical protein